MAEKFYFILQNGERIQCENLSEREDEFLISDHDVIKHLPFAKAIEHTHPDRSHHLSTGDRICQIQTGLTFILHGREYRCCPPLLGREFIHGESDCYALMRDFYMLATGYDMQNYERKDNWWSNGDDLYLDNLEDAGFEQVISPEVGDMILINLLSPKPNHAALYLGDGIILHHLPDRLSKRDIYGSKYRKLTHSFWRLKQWQPSDFTAILQDLAINSESK